MFNDPSFLEHQVWYLAMVLEVISYEAINCHSYITLSYYLVALRPDESIQSLEDAIHIAACFFSACHCFHLECPFLSAPASVKTSLMTLVLSDLFALELGKPLVPVPLIRHLPLLLSVNFAQLHSISKFRLWLPLRSETFSKILCILKAASIVISPNAGVQIFAHWLYTL